MKRVKGTEIILGVTLIGIGSAWSQTLATWQPAGGGLYSTAGNWSGGVVPINAGGTTYNVVIPTGSGTVSASGLGAATVDDFSLGAGRTFGVSGGTLYVVHDSAQILGIVDVDGGSFQALGANAANALGVGARLYASNLGVIELSATSYNAGPTGGDLFRAANGSLLDLSSIQTLNWGSGSKSISASNGGIVDLSGVTSNISSAGFPQVQAAGGTVRLGDLPRLANTTLSATANGLIDVRDWLRLMSNSTLTIASGSRVEIGGHFAYFGTLPTSFSANAGTIRLDGGNAESFASQFFEAAGADGGINGYTSGNFGVGRLEIGAPGAPSIVELFDFTDNGNRGAGREALYLYGSGSADALTLSAGSTLILNDVQVYARINGSMVHLNELFLGGQTSIPFGDGTLVKGRHPLPGDGNRDGSVTGADYTIWADHFGDPRVTFFDGDYNGDGSVTGADYTQWADHFGQSRVAATLPYSVPEPTGAALATAATCLIALLARSHRRMRNGRAA